jgi:outer membrane protein assembly factor BamB
MGSPFPLTPSVTNASIVTRIVGGATQVFPGSIGHILQVNVTNQSLAADNSNPGAASVVGRIALGTNGAHRIYAGDDGGRLWSLDPSNFAGTNKVWSYTVASDSIKSSPYYHYATNSIQFGTEAGKLVVLNASGTPYTGYPYVPGSTSDQFRGLLYWSGILIAGTENGKLFFLDRDNGTTGPTPLLQYFFGPSEVVSGIGYDLGSNRYMVSVADPSLNNGRVYLFDGLTDPTPGAQ